MQVIGVIVARGGSSLHRKNLLPLCGKPLLYWTCECAKQAKRLDKVIISTDDKEIAAYAKECGIDVPFERPKNLAIDTAPTVEVIRHALRYFPGYDAVFTLQPTDPLRIPADIDGAIELLEKSDGSSAVIGYSESHHYPARLVNIASNRIIQILRDFPQFTRRQELPKVFYRNGCVYLSRYETIEQGSIEGRSPIPYLIPKTRCWSVDDEEDLKICEAMIRSSKKIRAKQSVCNLVPTNQVMDIVRSRQSRETINAERIDADLWNVTIQYP